MSEAAAARAITLDCSVLQSLYAMCARSEYGLVEELVEVYLDSTPRQLEELRGAIGAHDVEGAVGTLHSMKGSAAMIGAVRLAALCRRLEKAAREGDLPPESAIIGMLEREIASLLAALDKLTSHLA
jgi:HPt (histidine-containing phosphotransfer) domain-containing protein